MNLFIKISKFITVMALFTLFFIGLPTADCFSVILMNWTTNFTRGNYIINHTSLWYGAVRKTKNCPNQNSVKVSNHFWSPGSSRGGGGDVLYRYNGLYGEAPLKRGTFARAGKSVISVLKREQNGSQTNFVAVEKSRVFYLFVFEGQCIYSS